MEKQKHKRGDVYNERMIFDEELADGLDFTEDDLHFNRKGELTHRQKKLLRHYIWYWNLPLLFLLFVLTFPGILLIGVLIVESIQGEPIVVHRHLSRAGGYLRNYLALASVPAALLWFYELNRFRVPFRDLRRGVVVSTHGTIKETNTDKGIWTFDHVSLYVDEKDKFYVPENNEWLAQIRHQKRDEFILYYTPNSKIIVSAEPLAE